MAPTAARRAKPVQRSSCQGLQGNPDACRPRRGSACNETNNGAPAEAQRSGFGGERRHSGGNELCRLRRSERSVTCADEAGGNARPVLASQSQPTVAMNPRLGGPGGGEAPRPFFPPISSGRNGGPGRVGPRPRRRPRGHPRQVDGAPRSSRPTSSTQVTQVTDRSLRRKRQSSFPPLCLLSPRRPLRWVAAGTPWNGPSGCHTPRRRRVKDAAPYLP